MAEYVVVEVVDTRQAVTVEVVERMVVEGGGSSVTDLDDVADSATRLAMAPAERSALAGVPSAIAAAVTAHEAASDPHPQYITAAEAGALVAAHEAAADPHPQYTSGAEATVIAGAAVTVHEAAANPHAQYLQDAPSDGSTYGRKNGAWEVAAAGSGLPPGGFFLDTLIKQSNVDGDAIWQSLPALLATLLPPNSWLQYAAVCPSGNINLATSHPTLDGVSSGAAAALYANGIGVVLLRNQTDPAENGLYDWSGDIEPLTRSASADESLELTGAVVMVILGTDAGNIYKQTAAAPVVDTDDVVWELVGAAPPPVVGLPSLPAIDSDKTGVYDFASGVAQSGAIDTWTPAYGGLGDLTSEVSHKPDGSDIGPLFAGGDVLVSASGKAIATGNMTLGFIWTPQVSSGGVDTLFMAGENISPEAAYYIQASESPAGDQNLALVAFHANQLSLLYNAVRRGHTHSIVYVFSTTAGRKVYVDGRLAESNPAHTGVPTLANGTYIQIGNNKPFYTQPMRSHLSAVAQYDGALAGDHLQTLIDWLEDKRAAVQTKLLQGELVWNGPRLAIIGHSFVRMMRYDAEDYLYGLRQGAEVPAIGMGGVDAQTTADMAARATAFAARYHDTRYLVCINGTNDLWNNHNLATMQANTTTLIANLLSAAPRAQIILSTIPPFGGAPWDSPAYRTIADGYNAWVTTQGYPILDLDALLRNPSAPTQLLAAYDSGDHVHPNAAGFKAIMRALDVLLPYPQTSLLDAHEAASDPHPQYTTAAEAGALITAHEAASDPHPGYLTPSEASAAYAALGHSHAASAISNTPAGNIAATTVQAAIDELDTEKAAASHAHAASAVTVTPTGGIAATDVQAALAELDTEKSPASHSHSNVSDGDKGDITVTGGVWTIDARAVTYGDMPSVANNKLLGRSTAGAGDAEEISIGSGLALSAGTISVNAVGSSGVGHFGSGSDGDVTISSGTTTLTRDMYYRNLTLSGTGVLNCAGYRVFVSEVLDLSAAPALAIQNIGTSGGASGGTTAGSAGGAAAAAAVGGGGGGGAGAAGGTAAGTQAAAPTNQTPANGGAGGAGAAGGAGSGGAGGALRAGATVSNALPIRRFAIDMLRGVALLVGGAGGAGGGSGGGDGTAGGGSGGGGAGGGVLAIFARTINRGASTAAGAITVAGTNGGAGGTPAGGNRGGGGGGGAGGGGWIYIAYYALAGAVATNMLRASGGAGGNGGNGLGTGVGGTGGSSGAGGRITLVDVAAGASSESTGSASVAGGAPSGTAGGSGASTNVFQISL